MFLSSKNCKLLEETLDVDATAGLQTEVDRIHKLLKSLLTWPSTWHG